MHVRARKKLQDVLTAIRLQVPAGARPAGACSPTASATCAPSAASRALSRRACSPRRSTSPAAAPSRSTRSATSIPRSWCPRARRPTTHLRALTCEGMARRYPAGRARERASQTVEHELTLIAELRYEPFFLTVHDIVDFARAQDILCQGRGSAANSAVCYCLGITEVDPGRMSVLFERFISKERNEPPDIDVDFEHERREEVIQYIYGKYGRERAALDRGGHHLPAAQRAARRRQGARPVARPGRPARQVDVVVGRPRGADEAPGGGGLRPRQPRGARRDRRSRRS